MRIPMQKYQSKFENVYVFHSIDVLFFQKAVTFWVN